jgi:hypothetical protein
MKNRFPILTLIVLAVFYSFTENENEKKKISNQLYSFSVPSDWECAIPGRTNECCSKPMERDAHIYHLYYLSWRSPVKNEDEFFNSISLHIETYQRLDGLPATIEEIEEIELSRLKQAEIDGDAKIIDKKDIYSGKKQKRFIVVKESKSISAKKGISMDKNVTVYLLYKSKNAVHFVRLFTGESKYQFPETKKIINDILDSFSS